MDGQDRQDGVAAGGEGLDRGLRMGLDCGLRRNDDGLGAVNRAPTEIPTLVRRGPGGGPPPRPAILLILAS